MNLPVEHFSWSQYQKYTNCGLQYYFKYVKKIFSPMNEYGIRGTAYHAGCKAAVLTRDLDATIEAYDQSWKENLAKATEDGLTCDTEILDRIETEGRNCIMAFFATRAPKIEVKGPESFEIKIEWNLGDVPMLGYVDCVDKHGDFIDFKTAKKRPNQPAWGQLILYGDAAETLYKISPRNLRFDYAVPYASKEEPAKIFHFKKGWKSTKREPHLKAVQYAAKEVENSVFAPCQADSWVCSPAYCEYFQICEFGKDRAIEAKIQEESPSAKPKKGKQTGSVKSGGTKARAPKGAKTAGTGSGTAEPAAKNQSADPAK